MPRPIANEQEALPAEKTPVPSLPADDLTLWDVIRVCVKRWGWFLLGLVVVANVVMLWHVFTPLHYEAEVRVRVPMPKKKTPAKENDASQSALPDEERVQVWSTPDDIGIRIRQMYPPGCEAGKPFGRAHIQRYQIDPTFDDIVAVVARADSKEMAVKFLDSALKRAEKEYQLRIDKALTPYREEMKELEKQFAAQQQQQEAIARIDTKEAKPEVLRLLHAFAQRMEHLLRLRQAELKEEFARYPTGTLEVRTSPRSLGQVGGRSFPVVLMIGLMLGTLAGATLSLGRETVSKFKGKSVKDTPDQTEAGETPAPQSVSSR
ncbi:MAG: hypothetical protein U0903_16010 [Planctomycetales bacterium]